MCGRLSLSMFLFHLKVLLNNSLFHLSIYYLSIYCMYKCIRIYMSVYPGHTSDSRETEKLKDDIRNHPMMPLLLQLMERCSELTIASRPLTALAQDDVLHFFQDLHNKSTLSQCGKDAVDQMV